MIAMLKFDCSEREQREELDRALKSLALCSILWDFEQYLRDIDKGHVMLQPDEMFDKIRERYFEIKDDHGIRLDELYS
jgi:hypothetical protein